MANHAVTEAVYWDVFRAVGETIAKRRDVQWTVNRAWYTAWYTAGFAAVPTAVDRAMCGDPPHPGLANYLEVVT